MEEIFWHKYGSTFTILKDKADESAKDIEI